MSVNGQVRVATGGQLKVPILRWQHTLPKVLVSIPWRPSGRVAQVTLDKRILRVGSDLYPVTAMSAVHVDSWENPERSRAWRQFRRTGIYLALPFVGLGIEFLRAGRTYAPAGGLLLGAGVLVLGISVGRYINHMRRPGATCRRPGGQGRRGCRSPRPLAAQCSMRSGGGPRSQLTRR